jgi:hypothetical protein
LLVSPKPNQTIDSGTHAMLDTGRIASTTGRKMLPAARTRPSSRPHTVADATPTTHPIVNTRRLNARSRPRSPVA